MFATLLAGVCAGLLLPVQTTINTRLGRRLGSVVSGSLVSFTIGTLGLALALAVARPAVDWPGLRGAPWWAWGGGLCGVAFLTVNMVLMRALGAGPAVVLPIAGQVLGGAAIDATGAFGAPVVALGPSRVAGILLVLAGAVLVNLPASHRTPRAADGAVGGPQRAPARPSPRLVAGLAAVALLTGSLSAVQTTVNGRLGALAHSPLLAAFVSFAVGTVALAVLAAATRQPLPLAQAARREPPYIWVGGPMGAVFVLANAAIAPVLGTGLTVAVVLLGQIAGGLGVDHTGALGATRHPLTPARVLGACAVLAGVALVRLVQA